MSKTSRILVGLSLIAFLVSPTFAEDGATAAARIRKPLPAQIVNTRVEKIASKTATLKTKLEAFKNKNKAAAAERINTNLNTINQNQTTQMQRHLDAMTVILNKLETRVSSPSAAIATARANIASASAAVAAQSEKDYTITVTSEAKIKTDAKKQRDALHADLLALRKIVIDAKQSVGNAIREGRSGGQ